MSLKRVIKTEIYKNVHRKSSFILLIPMLLAVVVSLGYAKGFVKLNLTVGVGNAYSCMDFVFIIWNVLYGLGIMGILLILFSSFQFSGEIERGQIKQELLRIGKRGTVVMGKYIAVLLVAGAAIVGTVLACIGSYYMFVAHSVLGTGTFSSTIEGISNTDIVLTIVLQAVTYLIVIAVSFLIGLKAGPFVTFILTMVVMYAGNYMAGAESSLAKLIPLYWSTTLVTSGELHMIPAVGSVVLLLSFTVLLMALTIFMFQKKDIK